jgi:WD40 repeat protein
MEAHTGHLIALCVLPGSRLASSSDYPENSIRVWDLATGVETARLKGHSDAIAALCLLPDGRLVSGSYDKTIRIWDATSGAETARLEVTNVDWPASGGVKALCVLPDGRLVSASSDNAIRLWDVATGTETARLDLGFPIRAIAVVEPKLIVVGMEFGMHWLEVLD